MSRRIPSTPPPPLPFPCPFLTLLQKPLLIAGQGVAGRFNVTMRNTPPGGTHLVHPVMYATTLEGVPYMYEVRVVRAWGA